MATTVANALSALRAQRTALLAENPVDNASVRMVRRLIRALRDPSASDDADDIRDAFRAIRDMEADPTLFVQSEWEEDGTLLIQKIGTMPVDDQDPAYIADPTLIRQDQVERVIRLTALNGDAAFDPVQPRCFEWLERFFGVYRNERPEEVEFTSLLASLNSGALDGAALAAALSRLEQLSGRLQP